MSPDVTRVRVGLVGLGTIGRQELDLWHVGGFATVGYDVSSRAIRELESAYSHTENPPELTTNPDPLRECDVLVLCLPTADASGTVSLRSFDDFVDLRRTGSWSIDQLTIVASTVPIGFSRDLARRIEAEALAHAPERFDPGRSAALGTIPRVVGGLTDEARDAAIAYYRRVGVTATGTSSLEVAEASKLLENAFRLVNIAFANEFGVLCQQLGIPTGEVIQAAASKPFGFMPHYPGPGAGGMCIPVVPRFLVEAARDRGIDLGILEASISSNDARPDLVGKQIDEILADRVGAARVLIVGATYKSNYPDTRGSTALKLIENLAGRYRTDVYDPLVGPTDLPNGVKFHSVLPQERYDIAVIAVRHDSVDLGKVSGLAPVLIDLTRGEIHGAPASIGNRPPRAGARR